MSIIKTKNLTFEYIRRDEEGNVEGITTAIDDVSLDIQQGDFIAILGHNGSGKSTLAKHMNAILYPTEGTVWVDGKDTSDEKNLWEIRQKAGMVFQNPDNQIIGQVVEEDVGFGPENLGVPTKEIWERVEESLSHCCSGFIYIVYMIKYNGQFCISFLCSILKPNIPMPLSVLPLSGFHPAVAHHSSLVHMPAMLPAERQVVTVSAFLPG